MEPKSFIGDGPWSKGINSLVDPLYLPAGSVQWSVNCLNRGGSYATRPGYVQIYDSVNTGEPRGLTIFKPKNRTPFIVKALGTRIRISPFPFTSWSDLLTDLDTTDNPISFEVAIKSAQTLDDGSIEFIDPAPLLFISTGTTKTRSWDGVTVTTYEPSEVPVCSRMKFIGNRLWVAQGSKVQASNILEPDAFTNDGLTLDSSGAFSLPGDCTGFAATPTFQSLLAFTEESVTSFAASIPDRGLWSSTPNFEQVVLPGIGCIAPKSIINQFGMVWWWSQGGLVNLDEALTAYRTSKLHYKDEAMARSKSNISFNQDRICCGTYGNLMGVSVPSGDIANAHNWIMDGAIDEAEESAPPVWASVWTGVQPVEWVTSVINGQPRCFVLSRDLSGFSVTSNVWEMFCPSRFDFAHSGVKNIPSSIETKYLGKDAGFYLFDHIRFLVGQLQSNTAINVQAFYASRHSGYKQVMDKDIISTIDSLTSDVEIEDNTVDARLLQTRWLKSSKDEGDFIDQDLVEHEFTRNSDSGFFCKLNWTGPLSLTNLIMVSTPIATEPMGRVEDDETTSRSVDADGAGVIDLTAPVASTIFAGKMSGPIVANYSRYQEETYSAF